MRRKMIAGNWKMNTTVPEALALVNSLKNEVSTIKNTEILVCPPYVSLTLVGEALKGSNVKLGAQNVFYEEKGAFTGEVSPLMLKGICEYVIIGHSERRQYFNETNEIVNKKIVAALKNDLKPILCVGENLEQNEAGETESFVSSQVKESLLGIDITESMIIAYEPIWAIGTGKAASAKQADDTIAMIRRTISGIYGDKISQEVRILYGGSVKPENTNELMSQSDIDGGLVGGASLKAEQFAGIIQQTEALK